MIFKIIIYAFENINIFIIDSIRSFMKKTLLLCFVIAHTLFAFGQNNDTMEVRFATNVTKLSKEASNDIDQLIFKDKLIHGQKLIVLGYADYVGNKEHNEQLSTARAKNVKDYLVASGFKESDIKLCVGKGEIVRAPVSGNGGYANDRKVQIIIDGSQPQPAPPAAPAVVEKKPKPVEKEMARLEKNETMALKDILFVGGSDELLPTSYPELEKLATFMLEHNTVKIQVEGHICCMMDPNMTDDMGPDGHSPLSERRAKKVYLYLVSKGVYGGRVKVIGLGNTRPLVNPEVTEEDREANRRVEIRILSK